MDNLRYLRLSCAPRKKSERSFGSLVSRPWSKMAPHTNHPKTSSLVLTHKLNIPVASTVSCPAALKSASAHDLWCELKWISRKEGLVLVAVVGNSHLNQMLQQKTYTNITYTKATIACLAFSAGDCVSILFQINEVKTRTRNIHLWLFCLSCCLGTKELGGISNPLTLKG